MNIYINDEDKLHTVYEHIKTVFETISYLNEGTAFTMLVTPHYYCDGKNNHISVSYNGNIELGNKMLSIIKLRLSELLPEVFDITTMSGIAPYKIEE